MKENYHSFLTNDKNISLVDRFNTLIKDSTNFDVIVGYFYLSGFHFLSESLKNTDSIRIIVGMKTDNKTIELYSGAKNSGMFSISFDEIKEISSADIIEELNNSDDSKESEKGIYQFIDWIKSNKLQIRFYYKSNLHAKVYISTFKEDDRDIGRVITGSSNFTKGGFSGNIEFNVELTSKQDYVFAKEKFEELWAESVDISETIQDTVDNDTWLTRKINPYEMYLKFLYEYFKEDLNYNIDLFYQGFPDGFKKLKYQEQAVINAKKIIDKYGGVFISDVVGLGKTYVGAMLASQLKGRTLVVASPALLDEDNPHSWVNIFRDFRLQITPLSIGSLQKAIDRGTYKYDNVIIDESHKFRNEMTEGYGLLSQICKGKKVVLISATPYNNSPSDILSQLKLFQNGKRSEIPGVKNLDRFFNSLQNKLKKLDRLKDKDEYMRIIEDNSALIRHKVLRHVMVRRTRTDIKKYFAQDLKKDTSDTIKFPEIQSPTPLLYQLDKRLDKIFNITLKLITYKTRFSYSRYSPLLYLVEKLKESEKTSQRNMGSFMKTLLVKRLESSFYAFRETVSRFINSYEAFIKSYDNGAVFISKQYSAKIIDLFLQGKDAEVQKLIDSEQAQKWDSKSFTKDFLYNLKRDLNTLKCIQSLWGEYWNSPDNDPKLQVFKKKLKTDTILNTSKLIIFTESVDTANYLYNELNKLPFAKPYKYHGKTGKDDLKTVLANFDPNNHSQSDDFRILITTDILAEGVNLHKSNVVVNYDIPWNPTNMIQRVGRVNRVDTKFDKLYTYNFFPTVQSNNQIKLKEAAEAKISAFIEMLGNDAKLLTESENVKTHRMWDTLNSKETLESDEEENNELKYFNVIQSIKTNNPELYEKIKKLPKKARIAREYGRIENLPSMITFFRKGLLCKFFLADNENSTELDFLQAAQLFEASQDEKFLDLNLDVYYKLLAHNKAKLEESFIEDEDEAVSKGSKDYGVRLLKILRDSKEMKAYRKTMGDDLEYLKNLIQKIEEGSIPKGLMKKIFESVKELSEPDKIIRIVKEKLPDDFLIKISRSLQLQDQIKKEIILSEIFVDNN